MMDFQIKALARQQFEHFFGRSADDLNQLNVRRMEANQSPGFPCRISLRDADVGETVLLLNYEHQSEHSPYRASHAIFVIEGAEEATPDVNQIPQLLLTRLLSVRAFNADHFMIAADVCEGCELEAIIHSLGARDGVEYLHIHNAKPGCFAAKVEFLTE